MENNIKDILKDIYTFSYFVEFMELEYGDSSSWLDMEIVNALALNEWDENGRPKVWKKWESFYKKEAEEVLLNFLSEIKVTNL